MHQWEDVVRDAHVLTCPEKIGLDGDSVSGDGRDYNFLCRAAVADVDQTVAVPFWTG